MVPGSSDGRKSSCDAGDLASIPGLGRSSGEGNGYPLRYSCLENSMDRGAWRATVHGFAKSWIRLSNFHFAIMIPVRICWACTICQSCSAFIPSLGGMFIFLVRPPSLREGSYLSLSYICLIAKLCPTLLQPHGLYPARLLCPWDFPGKNTGEGCHFLHQGIFLTQGWNPCLPHWQAYGLPLSHWGHPHSQEYCSTIHKNQDMGTA